MEDSEKRIPPRAMRAFRARQRLMLIADILDIAIVENLPASRLMAGNLKMRTNRIRADIDVVTKGLAKEILLPKEESVMGSKDYAYAFYTLINILIDWPDDALFELAEELKTKNPRHEKTT